MHQPRELDRTGDRWLWLGVGLGVFLRVYHYLRCPAVWHDEAALMANILRKSYAELLGPLDHTQAAPPLFLWLERTATLAFGESECCLRFLPLLFACLSMVLLAWVAKQILGRAAVWAVLLFAASDRLLWHACECKPYSIDVFAAILAIGIYVRSTNVPLIKPLLLSAVLFLLLMCLSYPTLFVVGGLMTAWGPRLWSEGRRADWLACVGLSGLFAVMIVLLYLGPIRAQRNPELEQFWAFYFPNWHAVGTIPEWAIRSLVTIGHYDLMPVGGAMLPLSLIGAAAWWRQRQHGLVLATMAPVGLAFAAASLHAYPFAGGRLMIFTAPAVILLTVAGIDTITRRMSRHINVLTWVLPLLIVGPVLAQTAHRIIEPWPRAESDAAAALVLAHRQPSDGIAHNHWDYEYYFRNEPGPILRWHGEPLPEGKRWWLVIQAQDPAHREILSQVVADRHILRREEFSGVTVILVD